MSEHITDEMVDTAMNALPTVPSLAKLGVGIAEFEGMRRALAAALDAMPVARVGYVLCETEDGFTGDCADWNCIGPHYAIHRGREVQP